VDRVLAPGARHVRRAGGAGGTGAGPGPRPPAGRVDGRPGVRDQDARNLPATVRSGAPSPHSTELGPVRPARPPCVVCGPLWAEVAVMRRAAWVRRAVMAAVVMVGAGAVWALTQYTALGRASTWERQVSPGELSAAHHFLNDNCAACHTPGKGPDAAQCAT